MESKEERTACSNQNLANYISLNLEYPEEARQDFIEGTVFMSFVIGEDGRARDAVILRDIGSGCGEEGVRLIELMPKWKPALKNGKPVPIKFTMPLTFGLDDERPKEEQAYRILWGTISNREQISPEALRANLNSDVFVLDELGNKIATNELLFAITKRKRYRDASSTGTITADMIKLAGKVKRGMTFSVIGTIQVDGEFIFVEKDFEIIKGS